VVLEPRGFTDKHLVGVFGAHDLRGNLAGLFLALVGKGFQRLPGAVQQANHGRVGEIPLGFHLGQGFQAAGAARMPHGEGHIAIGGALLGPGEVMGGLVGLIVFVNAEEAEIQIVAGPAEVVPVLAEGGHIVLRGHDQAHILVLLVAVDPDLPALVEIHRLTHQLGALGLGLHQLGQGLAAGSGRLLIGHFGKHRLGHFFRHVFHFEQGVEHQSWNLDFFSVALGHEPVFHEIVLGIRNLLDPIVAHVMVGEHQAILADERAAATRKAHGGKAHMIQPGLIRGKVELGLHLLGGQVIKGPHALIRAGSYGQQQGQGTEGNGSYRTTHEVDS